MQAWLIHASENSVDRTIKMDTENQALQFIGHVVIGDHPGTTIKNIYAIDTVAGTITALETFLNGLTLGLRNKTT
jgi:hypothetical protein